MKTKKNGKNYGAADSSGEIAAALGIDSPADAALMKYKARLSKMACLQFSILYQCSSVSDL
jgi:hypothetical protein